jgi:serine/threonine-protein kinase
LSTTRDRNVGLEVDGERESAAPTLRDVPAQVLTIAPESLVLESRIGRGGMGEVWRARDQRLGRSLALKLLRPERSEQVGPLLAEAQAQARIDHPHVCKVYGFGELDGTPFIALQLIEGTSLAKAAPKLSPEEKVRVVAQVAAGIEAAHGEGLIHRDIKPQNILVERHTGGVPHAYVVDFGLARDLGSETEKHVSGTVEYMSPEQACGDHLDERADVWGLGVTLYELFAGTTPFRASTAAATLGRLLSEDPPPLGGVPRDLARIVMKCLERARERRYPTAGELRADLERYLAGEPVEAMPPSLIYRLGKRAHRHRFAFVAGTFAALVLISAATLLVRAQLRSAELGRRSAEYARDIERFETTMHQAALLPLHDTRPERARVEKRLRAIEAELPKLRPETAALAQHALGRGELALGNNDAAVAHLERAWAQTQAPEVGLALGRALAARYAEELNAAANLSAEERKERRAQLASRYGERIKQLLSIPTDDPGAAHLARAQITFADERDEDAMAAAQAALASQPWLFEAYRLRGEVEVRRSRRCWDAGDMDAVRAALERAGRELASAIRIASSDGASRIAECSRQAMWVRTFYDQSRLHDDSFAAGQAACQAALQADGGEWPSLVEFSGLLRTQARYEAEHGHDGEPTYRRSVELIERAAAARPGDPEILLSLSGAHNSLGSLLGQRGHSGALAEMNAAVKTVERALELAPKSWLARNSLVLTLQDRAGLPDNRDAGGDLARAAAFAEVLATERPESMRAQNGLGTALDMLASWQATHGRDPRATWQRSVVADEAVQRISPKTDYGFINGCNTLLHRANFLRDVGEDPRPDLARAEAACRRSIAVDDQYFETPRALASVLAFRARIDPGAPLEEARALLAKGRKINPKYDAFDSTEVQIALVRAEREARRDPRSALAEASRAIAAGRAHNPGADWFDDATAEVARAEVEWRQAHGQPFADLAQAGLAAAKRAADGGNARTLVHAGAIALAQAKAAMVGERVARAKEAVALLERALAENANLKHLATPLLDEARRLAGP